MATERIRYVNTDASGGTYNGLAWATAYRSLSACEDAEDGDLMGADVWLHVYCEATGGTADTATCTFQGSTLDATRYILIEAASAANSSDGKNYRATASGWKTDRYRISVDNAAGIAINDDFVRLDGLQIETYNCNNAADAPIYMSGIAASNDLRFTNCRIRQDADSGVNSLAISVQDADCKVQMWNCIVEKHPDMASTTGTGIYAGGAQFDIYNCLVYGFARGINAAAANLPKVKDSVVLNNGDDFYGTFEAGEVAYCASDDNDGSNNVAEDGGGVDWTGDFTDGSAGDWTLLVGSNLIGAGGKAGSALFSTDIEGTTRGDAWDVGPFEYVAAATGMVNEIVMIFEC